MYLIFIIFLDAFVPLSTDLYLPALPSVAAHFGASVGQINLTLSGFMVFFSVGMLIWGPLSDKYGRMPVLRIGLFTYFVTSLLCALSHGLFFFVLFRMLQGLGGGAATAVSVAMVKDLYSGREQEKVLAVVQSLVVITPIIAPSIGAFLLRFFSWRGDFILLAAFGFTGFVYTFFIKEPLRERSTGAFWTTFSRPFVVLANPHFTVLLFLFSLPGFFVLGFIAICSFIYVQGFGLSPQQFAIFFGINAIMAMIGPALYIVMSRYLGREKLVQLAFFLLAVSGALIVFFGSSGPVCFLVLLLPGTLASTFIRPPGTWLMLAQQEGDNGSVASLISCVSLLFGVFGMVFVSLPWQNAVRTLGAIALVLGILCSLLWLACIRWHNCIRFDDSKL